MTVQKEENGVARAMEKYRSQTLKEQGYNGSRKEKEKSENLSRNTEGR